MATCIRCETATLGKRNKTGYCSKCWPKVAWDLMRADPTFEARRVAGINKSIVSNPERRKQMAEVMQRVTSLPQSREARRRKAKEMELWKIGHEAIKADPTLKARRGKSLSATRLAWCPVPMRATYLAMQRTSKVPAPELRRMILEEWAKKHGFDAGNDNDFPWGRTFGAGGMSEELQDAYFRREMIQGSAKLLAALRFHLPSVA